MNKAEKKETKSAYPMGSLVCISIDDIRKYPVSPVGTSPIKKCGQLNEIIV